MGEDKALRPFLGTPLIARIRDRFKTLGEETLVITNQISGYQFLDLPLYQDILPGRGALGGLYTALQIANQPIAAVIAADLPFASPKLVEEMLEIIQQNPVDAVLPSTKEGLEPYHAVYRCHSCLPLVKAAIDHDRWKMTSWHDAADIQVLDPQETRRMTGSPWTFMNVNTPEEFNAAENLAFHHPDL